jgi:hypothetical protein
MNGRIALTRGVSHVETCNSTWCVVDAVNKYKKLDIQFSSNHKERSFFDLFVGGGNRWYHDLDPAAHRKMK